MKWIYIITGRQGSGKTILTRRLAGGEGTTFFEMDSKDIGTILDTYRAVRKAATLDLHTIVVDAGQLGPKDARQMMLAIKDDVPGWDVRMLTLEA